MKRSVFAILVCILSFVVLVPARTIHAAEPACFIELVSQNVNQVVVKAHTGGPDGQLTAPGAPPITVNDGWQGQFDLDYNANPRNMQVLTLTVPGKPCWSRTINIPEWDSDPGNDSLDVTSHFEAAMPVAPGSKAQFCLYVEILRGGPDGNFVEFFLYTQGELPAGGSFTFDFGDGSSDFPNRDGDVYRTSHSYDAAVLASGVYPSLQPSGLGDFGDCLKGFMNMEKGNNTFIASNIGPSGFVN